MEAVIEVPANELSSAERLLQNANSFEDSASLKELACFRSSMMAGSILTKFIDQNSKGMIDCNTVEHQFNPEKQEEGTVLDSGRVILLDKGNRRLLVYVLSM